MGSFSADDGVTCRDENSPLPRCAKVDEEAKHNCVTGGTDQIDSVARVDVLYLLMTTIVVTLTQDKMYSICPYTREGKQLITIANISWELYQ